MALEALSITTDEFLKDMGTFSPCGLRVSCPFDGKFHMSVSSAVVQEAIHRVRRSFVNLLSKGGGRCVWDFV